MKRFGMDYPTAVREVGPAGRDRRFPSAPGRAGPDPLEPLFGAVAVAQDWFTRQLLEAAEAKDAREYLEGRDDPAGDRRRSTGWASRRRARRSSTAMAELGLEDAVLLEAGLAAAAGRRHGGAPVPRRGCCSRSTICAGAWPGSAAGCSGRASPSISTRPRTPIFHKGKQLYNLHQAKGADPEGRVGHPGRGLLRRAPAGARRHRARGGAAGHGAHRRTRPRCSGASRPRPSCSTTATRPGLRATFRAGDELLRHGVRVRVATMPAGRGSRHAGAPGRRGRARAARCDDAMDLLERKIQLLSRRAGSRAWTTSARRSTGCCRPSARRPTRSRAIST